MTTAITKSLLERTYRLYIPDGIGSDAPLIIVLHPGLSNAFHFETNNTGTGSGTDTGVGLGGTIDAKADIKKYYVCYPNGTEPPPAAGTKTWNAGWCCGYAHQVKKRDIEFIKLLIRQLQIDYSIDATKIYLFGYSNGGMLSYSYMCAYPADIAAATICAGTLVLDPFFCANSIPIPITHINGDLDTNVPPAGGNSPTTPNVYYKPISTVISFLTSRGATINHITLVGCDHFFSNIRNYLISQENTDIATIVDNMIS